jgi:hypothetical protein
MATVFPEVAEQPCWNHRIVNVLDTLPLETARRRACAAHADPIRGDAGGRGAAEGRVPGVGHEEGGARRGSSRPTGRLIRDIFQLTERCLTLPLSRQILWRSRD